MSFKAHLFQEAFLACWRQKTLPLFLHCHSASNPAPSTRAGNAAAVCGAAFTEVSVLVSLTRSLWGQTQGQWSPLAQEHRLPLGGFPNDIESFQR